MKSSFGIQQKEFARNWTEPFLKIMVGLSPFLHRWSVVEKGDFKKIRAYVKLGNSDWVSSTGLWTTFQENVINVIAKNAGAMPLRKFRVCHVKEITFAQCLPVNIEFHSLCCFIGWRPNPLEPISNSIENWRRRLLQDGSCYKCSVKMTFLHP